MKIQLDTENNTICIDEDVNLGKFINMIGKLLPKGEWKKFTLKTNVIIDNWSTPTIIEKRTDWVQYPQPWRWYDRTGGSPDWTYKPSITCSATTTTGTTLTTTNNASSADVMLQNGVFNIEVKE